MNDMQLSHKIVGISDVLGTVHGAFGLTFEKYAGHLQDGDLDDASRELDTLNALLPQMRFLVDELSALDQYGTEETIGLDPDQLDLLSPVEIAIVQRDGTPEVTAQTPAPPHTEGRPIEPDRDVTLADFVASATTVQLVESPVTKEDVGHAAVTVNSLLTFFTEQGDMAKAKAMLEAGDVLRRAGEVEFMLQSDASFRETKAQVRAEFGIHEEPAGSLPATKVGVASDRLTGEGDLAAFTDFAVNPDKVPQLLVGILRADGALVWSLGGEVPDGAFVTLRQRLQMFADTVNAVELARAAMVRP